MSPELDKKLCEKYPKIFRDRKDSIRETGMAWGFSHGDGWYDIIDSLCEAATYTYETATKVDKKDGQRLGLEKRKYNGKYYLKAKPPQMIADQVKEKFGILRFYYHLEFDPVLIELNKSGKYPQIKEIVDRYSNYFDGIIHYAEVLSGRTCEVSGKRGELHVTGGNRRRWYRTLNKEEAINNPKLKDKNFVPVSSLPKDDAP